MTDDLVYKQSNGYVTKHGHTMFPQDITKELNRKAVLEGEIESLKEKINKIEGAVKRANDWASDQENGLTDSQICISAMKDVRRIINEV